MPRTSNTQLPTSKDILDILRAESQRIGVKYDFLELNPDIYDAYCSLASVGEWIDKYKEMTLDVLAQQAYATTEQLYGDISTGHVPREVLNILFDRLAIEEAPRKADAVFVFGSAANDRVIKAVKLYKQGISSSLVVSGNRPYYDNSALPEAERMRDYAIANGVPDEAIIVERESITLPDNVKRTLDIFEAHDWRPKSLVIIASTFVMRRALMEWYRFTPWDITVIPVSADEQGLGEYMRRDMWFKHEKGIRLLLNEYAKMILEHKMELLRLETNIDA